MTALAKTQQASPPLALFPATHEWALMKESAGMLVRSGFLPRAVDTPEKAIAIMLKGRELGIPPMQAFAHIAIVEGKPTMSAELMRSQVYRLVPGGVLEIEELSASGCKIRAARPGRKATVFTWGLEDARAAGLLGKQNWQKYPKAMYLARCTAEACRAVFPDALMGVSYTPEELNPELEVDDYGSVVEAVAKPVVATQAAAPAAPAPAAASRGSIYTGTKEQQDIIAALLRKREVPESLWDEIDQSLRGRPSGDITAVIAEVRERAAKAGPVEEKKEDDHAAVDRQGREGSDLEGVF